MVCVVVPSSDPSWCANSTSAPRRAGSAPTGPFTFENPLPGTEEILSALAHVSKQTSSPLSVLDECRDECHHNVAFSVKDLFSSQLSTTTVHIPQAFAAKHGSLEAKETEL